MRLTNYIRKQIEDAVLAKLPEAQKLSYYQEKVKPLVEGAFLARVPQEVRDLWNSKNNIHYLSLGYYHVQGLGFSVAVPMMRNASTIKVPLGEDADKYTEEFKTGNEARILATSKLREALNSCQTLKTLKERYPELIEFLPSNCTPHSITVGTPIVQNALSGFKSLGLSMSSPAEGEAV